VTGGLILVVDDDDAIRDTIAEILELEGYPVERAADGLQALEVVERVTPALVLLDMRMPVLDGWGFAQELERRGVSLPIVVITAAQNALEWCREVKARACVPKPFDLDDLLATVERCLAEAGDQPRP
jgi:two-component system chemotaxis response regulator CheY